MAQVLSQEEVDALLSAVNESSDANHDDDDFTDEVIDDGLLIQTYDLTNQDRVIRGRMPILEIIYERFIRSFQSFTFQFTTKNMFYFYDFNRSS